jgi:tetratricopeptide (TPR) repeat protein
VRRFEAFKRLPPGLTQRHQDLVSAHLLSGGGSGRWQFWAAAFDEWRSAPLLGRGAGSYEAWWARHGSFPYFVRNAHSLYLEVLGELGVLGLGLLLAAFAAGLVAAVRRLRDDGDDRMTVAAGAACLVAFAAGAAIDWVWQIPVVAIVGIGCLGLLAGGTGAGRTAEIGGRGRAAVAAVAVALALAEAVPLLATVELHASQRAFRRGDLASARSDAETARRLQPWSASPYVQLALVDEDAADYAAARRHIAQAIRRSDEDWRLWLVSARLATRAGAIPAALASLDRARELNPRSPLFASSREPG